jgi:hypothetical protein
MADFFGVPFAELPEHPYDRYYVASGVAGAAEKEVASMSADDLYHMLAASPSNQPSMMSSFMMAFIKAGKNTFVVRRDMLDMFQRTKLSGLYWEDIPAPPFPVIYVDLRGSGLVTISATDGLPSYVTGAFFADHVNEAGDRSIRYAMWAKERPEGVLEDILESDASPALIEFMKMVPPSSDADPEWKDAHLIGGVSIPAGALHDVAQTIEATKDHMQKRAPVLHEGASDIFASVNADASAYVMSLFANLVLYLKDAIHGEVFVDLNKKHKKKLLRIMTEGTRGAKGRMTPGAKNAKAELLKYGATSITVLRPLPNEKKASASSQNSKVRLHWVRGHWRRQPIGPKEDRSVKMTWIRPHQKGTAQRGAVTSHTYRVE